MAKRRTQIPVSVAEQVMFDADFSCCVCRERGHHIHHIDGDPSNNEHGNLVLLCFTHHDEVTGKGGLARRLTPGLLCTYRDHWHREVKSRRAHAGAGSSLSEMYYRAAFDAHSCVEIRKLRPVLFSAEWDEALAPLSELGALLSPSAPNARYEAIQILDLLAIRTRHKMPRTIARYIRDLAEECLDLKRHPHDETLSEVTELDQQTSQYGCAICGSLIHDGDKYLNNLSVVEMGCELLWRMMLHARHVRSDALLQETERCYDWHFRHRSKDAARLMKLYRKHAHEGKLLQPELPDDLDEKIVKASLGRELD